MYSFAPKMMPHRWALHWDVLRDGRPIDCVLSGGLPGDLFFTGVCGPGNWTELKNIIQQEYERSYEFHNEDFDLIAAAFVQQQIPEKYR